MLHKFLIFIVGIFTSFYFFPFEFSFIPGINVKMMLAVGGLFILAVQMAKGKNARMDKDFLVVSILAMLVSLIGLFSVVWNGTLDYAYASYFISMWVWLSAAYFICTLVKQVHGEVSVEIIIQYLLAICLIQCALALMIDNNSSVKTFVDTYIAQGQNFLNANNVKRLYGIGASLDVAGSRFSAVLVLLSFLIMKNLNELSNKLLLYYVVSFFFLAIVGNMVARTTTVGLIIGVFYLFIAFSFKKDVSYVLKKKIIWEFILVIGICIPLFVYLYNDSPFFHKQIRFAFEGFFSLAEKGEWDVASNETLKDMFVFPETVKTWLIGDGYFSPPQNTDPYFIGIIRGGYYMGTDVGYLRFIFYFGLIGLVAFSSFILKVGLICIRKFKEYKLLFIMLLAVNFIVWFKVSTDIFLVFALFLMISKEENDAYDERLKLEV